ncbi:hypothetical protein LIER_39971 [Lithospermum erythrorhizon]|uniref:Pectin acetylesterase n=1 Tax=Lithospermum erythrorhizon TaxID=34254 RepID=A0AAV3QNX1_LITER
MEFPDKNQESDNRRVTFCKLRNGLLKKAYELSVLRVAEVALIVFSSLYEYSNKRLARSKPMEARLASIIAVVVTSFALLDPAASTHTILSARAGNNQSPLVVGFTYIQGAAAKGAVCLDGTLPGYHFHPGFGAGANSWLVDLEVC